MTRNEFKNDPLEGMTDLQIQDLLKAGEITHNDVRQHRGLPPIPSQSEGDLDQEAKPIGRPETTHLADLRKSPGFATTQAHIAERFSSEDESLLN